MARKTLVGTSLVFLLLAIARDLPVVATGSSLYAPLSGRVTDPKGAPIEGARVEAFRVHREPGNYPDIAREQLTPADGTFRFEKLPTGTEWHLRVRNAGLAQDEDPDYRIASGGTEAGVVLHPERPFAIRVLCAETGDPIPGATVRVGHGRIVLPIRKAGAGEWTVRACSGRIRLNISVAIPGYHGQYFHRERGTEGTLTVRLKPAGDIDVSGVAVDEKGRPVARASVFAVRMPGLRRGVRRHIHSAFTDERGRFTLVRLMGRESYRIWARRINSGPHLASQWISAVPRKDLKLKLVLVRTGRISARVVAPTGHPKPISVSARVHRSDRPDHTEHYATSRYSEKNGVFLSGGNPPGVYDLVIRPFPYPEITVNGVEVTAGRTIPLGKLTVVPGTEVTVGIKDARGRSHDDYRVRLLGENGRLVRVSKLRLPDGTYVTGQVPAGTWRILASAKKPPQGIHDLGPVTVKPGAPQVFTRTIPATGTVVVRVIDKSGRPISDHPVTFTAARPAPLDRLLAHGFRLDIFDGSDRQRAKRLWRVRDLRTESNGKVELGPLAPGTYVVVVGTNRRSVELAAGATVVVEFVVGQ